MRDLQKAKPSALCLRKIGTCAQLQPGAVYLVDNDPESPRRFRKYFIALIAAGVVTWIVGLFTGALMLLIVGGSLAVAGACGLFGRFD